MTNKDAEYYPVPHPEGDDLQPDCFHAVRGDHDRDHAVPVEQHSGQAHFDPAPSGFSAPDLPAGSGHCAVPAVNN